eukprot:5322076-Karenia_brevis.AAC.1
MESNAPKHKRKPHLRVPRATGVTFWFVMCSETQAGSPLESHLSDGHHVLASHVAPCETMMMMM